ncbi:hypothetical protein ETAA8_27630 [Anatilimnocola aggregata]|uniref:N-acetyltransferase domain-containing protein n=1 Tax=Anatilimnocola aggregata TaxID=2528021 RepID=A0A517YBS7_9BACT|nr:hypothetical protein [Anatilimnocola aggregata]QDU27674.1 hypothetical protein ETAA8_27630 [Anatilimnocola aggregata]
MPAIEKLTAAMFPEVFDTLLREFDPQMPEAKCRRAFEPRGWHDEDHFGYVLRDQGRPVGVLGALFSRRLINGQDVRFCNLHNWYVQPAHRAASLLLMRPILALKDHVVTDLSASGEVVAISERLGFSKLDRTIRLLPKMPRGRATADVIELTSQPELAEAKLTPTEFQLYRDHQGIECRHLWIESSEGSCYLVASLVASRWLPHVFVHHLTNPEVFSRHHRLIRQHLLSAGGYYVAVNEPHLHDQRIPCSLRADANQRLVRGNLCPPAAIDSLYSEMPLFKLPIHPRPPLFIRGLALKLWRWKQAWTPRKRYSAGR